MIKHQFGTEAALNYSWTNGSICRSSTGPFAFTPVFASCCWLFSLIHPPEEEQGGDRHQAMLGPVSDYSRVFVLKAGWVEGECFCIFLRISFPPSLAEDNFTECLSSRVC